MGNKYGFKKCGYCCGTGIITKGHGISSDPMVVIENSHKCTNCNGLGDIFIIPNANITLVKAYKYYKNGISQDLL